MLATLVIQGLTLGPLVRLLKLDGEDGLHEEINQARAAMISTALQQLEGRSGETVDHWRYSLKARLRAVEADDDDILKQKHSLGLATIRQQRKLLEEMRRTGRVGADAFLIIQEELDFTEVSLSSETDRQIEEN